MTKIKEMYKMMNVNEITKTVQNHQNTVKVKPVSGGNELLSGAFKIEVCFAENLKPTLKSGNSNPYVIIRVPEGTIKPPDEVSLVVKAPVSPDDSPPPGPQPTILKGSSCELCRYAFCIICSSYSQYVVLEPSMKL